MNQLNPKTIYLQLYPYLEKNTNQYIEELWELLLSAQEDPDGIPKQILEKEIKLEQEKGVFGQIRVGYMVQERIKRANRQIEQLSKIGYFFCDLFGLMEQKREF